MLAETSDITVTGLCYTCFHKYPLHIVLSHREVPLVLVVVERGARGVPVSLTLHVVEQS